jgi:hypothetical protein
MGLALIGIGSTATQAGTAGNFSAVAGNGVVGNQASTLGENFLQIFAPFACQISGLTAAQGSLTGPFTLQLRRSGVNVGNVITDTAPTDSTHVDSYTNAQAMILQWGTGSTGNVQRIQALLQTTAQQHGAIYTGSHSGGGASITGGATAYPRVAGQPGASTVESNSQSNSGVAGVLNGMFIQVPTNTTTAPSTVTSRINGANGNQTFTIAAGTTVNARVSPTGATDTINVGDFFCGQIIAGAGGSLSCASFGFGFTPNVGNQNDIYAFLAGSWPAGGAYYPPYGNISSSTSTAAAANIAPGFAGAITRFCVNVTGNTLTSAGNVNANINGANVAPSGILLGVGLTGWFVSGGGQTSFGPTDRICVAINGGSGAGLTFGTVAGMTLSSSAGYTAGIVEAGSAADTVGSRSTFPEVITESGSAADTSIAAAAPFTTIIAETGSATDTPTSKLAATTLTIAEVGDAEDVPTSQARFPTAIVEAGDAEDVVGATAIFFDTIHEFLSAGDTVESSAASIRASAVSATSASLDTMLFRSISLQAFTNPIAGLLQNRLTPGNLEPVTSNFPPAGPTTTQNIIQAYAYVQYQDDDSIQAFFQAYNEYAQAYLNYLNVLNLPIYTDDNITGSMLDWVAYNLYGFRRPVFITAGSPQRGPLNTWQLNSLPLNTYIAGIPASFTFATDDVYKRVLTWHIYKDDGKVFDVEWLKRRVGRFIYGVNGTDPYVNPYSIGVTITGRFTATIRLPGGPMSDLFAQAVAQAVVELPFQITWATGQNDGIPLPTVPLDALIDTPALQPVLDSNQDYILSGTV